MNRVVIIYTVQIQERDTIYRIYLSRELALTIDQSQKASITRYSH